uniref:Imm63 domain-containing protein n=1 Tax=Parastrongyloides trichosuri TaxID=131310 RepID=A0A0N4ZBN7_PARTI
MTTGMDKSEFLLNDDFSQILKDKEFYYYLPGYPLKEDETLIYNGEKPSDDATPTEKAHYVFWTCQNLSETAAKEYKFAEAYNIVMNGIEELIELAIEQQMQKGLPIFIRRWYQYLVFRKNKIYDIIEMLREDANNYEKSTQNI